MARPSKGDRAAHMVKADPAVTRRLVRKAANAGVSSASQYIADVLALHVGLPDHVLELNQMAIVTKRKLPQLKGDPGAASWCGRTATWMSAWLCSPLSMASIGYPLTWRWCWPRMSACPSLPANPQVRRFCNWRCNRCRSPVLWSTLNLGRRNI